MEWENLRLLTFLISKKFFPEPDGNIRIPTKPLTEIKKNPQTHMKPRKTTNKLKQL